MDPDANAVGRLCVSVEGAACHAVYHSLHDGFYRRLDPGRFSQPSFRKGFTHVWVSPMATLFVPSESQNDPVAFWDHAGAWLKAAPEAFPLVYRNDPENVLVYQVKPSERFQKAYRQYQEFIRGLQMHPKSDWAAQIRLLDQIIRLDPFPSALNAYGAMALLSGHSLPLARRRLQEAVETLRLYDGLGQFGACPKTTWRAGSGPPCAGAAEVHAALDSKTKIFHGHHTAGIARVMKTSKIYVGGSAFF